jgi:hypothetical protein
VPERAAFVAAACAGDAALQRDVEALLDTPPTDEGVFAAPALAMAGQMVSDVHLRGWSCRPRRH